ncbi:hypothetical protein SDC9_177142 [bioreactor metagenome]|uniref:Uncharacterized protein n=1 Tax=bioreactor metagenome TaxID=1076179 RepID=A0A645GVB3_9ZZZZ
MLDSTFLKGSIQIHKLVTTIKSNVLMLKDIIVTKNLFLFLVKFV